MSKIDFLFQEPSYIKTSTMSTQQEYIQNLIQNETKLNLEEFFKNIHQKFYSNQDISFMTYFLELTTQEGEFVVHHEKLIEYGVMTTKNSARVKDKLNALDLVEDVDYSLLEDILQQWEGSRGIKHTKVYMLTPEAFKTCLMRARKYPNQIVDPKIYSKYYLLLEKTYKLYTDYEKQLLNKQLEQQSRQLEHQAHQLEHKSQQLEDKTVLVLRLNEMLIDSTKLPKTQVVYIATSSTLANQNTFKVGGVESLNKLESRLLQYNSAFTTGNPFYYTDWFLVHNYREIENRLKDLIGRFREQISKEIYVLHYTKLLYILKYLVDNYNEEVDVVNANLADFIASLDTGNLDPFVPKAKYLKSIKITSVGQPTVKIEANTDAEIVQKLEEYFKKMDMCTKSVTFKSIFDELDIKRDRLKLYPTVIEIGKKTRPDVVVKKK